MSLHEHEHERTRMLEVLEEMAPAGAHCFVNGPYETHPHWHAGWIDNWLDPELAYIEVGDYTDSLLRRLKKERDKRKYDTSN